VFKWQQNIALNVNAILHLKFRGGEIYFAVRNAVTFSKKKNRKLLVLLQQPAASAIFPPQSLVLESRYETFGASQINWGSNRIMKDIKLYGLRKKYEGWNIPPSKTKM
jgi:hypothetical protein